MSNGRNSSSSSSGYPTRSMKSANLSIDSVEYLLCEGQYAELMDETASIYLTSVLEYLISEILELAGDMTHQSNRKRITPRDITLAIKNHPELAILFTGITIPDGGVQPFIHEELMKTNPSRAKRKVRFNEVNTEYLLSDIDESDFEME